MQPGNPMELTRKTNLDNNGNPKIILDLCGGTGAWGYPYAKAGYDVRVYDENLMFGDDVITMDIRFLKYIAEEVYGILCAPPCTEFAVSGARWWVEKGDGPLLDGLSVMDSCLRQVTLLRPKFWALENPVGRMVDYLGEPKLRFHPYEYGDPWNKKTCIWGVFNMPVKKLVDKPPGTMADQVGGGTAGKQINRSVTPPGFAQAFFKANR